MKQIFLFSGLLVFGISLSLADSPKANLEYQLKNKSTFDQTGLSRNPFVPIDYRRPVTVISKSGSAVAPAPLLTPSMFKVSSIIIGVPNVAVINGRDHAEGDWFELKVGDKSIDVRLISVKDGAITVFNQQTGNIEITVK